MTDRLDIADLHREMIGSYLQSRGFRFLRYDDGDFFVRFRWVKRFIDFTIGTVPDGGVLWFEATASTIFSIDQMPLLLLVTNEFMSTHRWPRLTVTCHDDEVDIVADSHLCMNDSLEQYEVARFLDSGLGATRQFWEDFVLPDVDGLEAEITNVLSDHHDGAA